MFFVMTSLSQMELGNIAKIIEIQTQALIFK